MVPRSAATSLVSLGTEKKEEIREARERLGATPRRRAREDYAERGRGSAARREYSESRAAEGRLAKKTLDLRVGLFNGVEVRRVWRQVEQLAARVLNKLPDPLTLVDAEVVHHHQLPALVVPPSPKRKAEEKRAGILRDSSSFFV